MAGDLEQSTGAVEQSSKNPLTKSSYATTATATFGITRNEFQELATLLGAQPSKTAEHLDRLGDKTKDLITLGADLSAQFGGTTAEAIRSIAPHSKANATQSEKYGVGLKAGSNRR